MRSGLSRITDFDYKLIYYSDTMCIRGKYEVAGYENGIIILRCSGDNICIQGNNLSIESLDCDEIYISGKLTDISFNYREDFA